MSKYNPDLIFIRAKDKNGKWASLSVTEAPATSLLNWWLQKALNYYEGAVLDRQHRQAMLDILEMLEVPLTQIKPAPSTPPIDIDTSNG